MEKKREYKVNEIFENQILNEIYETRGDGLECFLYKNVWRARRNKGNKTRFFKNKRKQEDTIK